MCVDKVLDYFKRHPWAIKCGAKKIAKDTKSSIEEVLSARKTIRESLGKRVKLYKKYEVSAKNMPKILIFDIETSPMLAYVWKRWKENISLDLTISEWFVICWSAKWLYSNEVMGEVLTPDEIIIENDERIVKSLWELFNLADIVVAHNGNKFDIPKMNSRFIIHNLPPTTPYYSVDTLTVAKKQFGFSSNKLDALAEYFGYDHKLSTTFELWKKCLEGDSEALEYMLEYNKRDVTLLEEVYLKLRPWIKGGPNISAYLNTDINHCCKCGSTLLNEIKDKHYYTTVGKYKLYRCTLCGAISRGRKNENFKLIKTTIIGH